MRALSLSLSLCIAVLTLLGAFQRGQALQSYQSSIPNGASVERNGVHWPGVGHEAGSGGGALNPFGEAFRNASFQWTTDLCDADSDGDGYSNGDELGDPFCVWVEGDTPQRTKGISHPGFADSFPSEEWDDDDGSDHDGSDGDDRDDDGSDGDGSDDDDWDDDGSDDDDWDDDGSDDDDWDDGSDGDGSDDDDWDDGSDDGDWDDGSDGDDSDDGSDHDDSDDGEGDHHDGSDSQQPAPPTAADGATASPEAPSSSPHTTAPFSEDPSNESTDQSTQGPASSAPPLLPVEPQCSSTSNGTILEASSGLLLSDADGEQRGYKPQKNERCAWAINCSNSLVSHILLHVTVDLTLSTSQLDVADTQGFPIHSVVGGGGGDGAVRTIDLVAPSRAARIHFSTASVGEELGGGFRIDFICVVPTADDVSQAKAALGGSPAGIAQITQATAVLVVAGSSEDRALALGSLNAAVTHHEPTRSQRHLIVSQIAAAVDGILNDDGCDRGCRQAAALVTSQIIIRIADSTLASGAPPASREELGTLMTVVSATAPSEAAEAAAVRLGVAAGEAITSGEVLPLRTSAVGDSNYASSTHLVTSRFSSGVVGSTELLLDAGSVQVVFPTSSVLLSRASSLADYTATIVASPPGELHHNSSAGSAGTRFIGSSTIAHVILVRADSWQAVEVDQLDVPIRISMRLSSTAAAMVAAGSHNATCVFITSSGEWKGEGVTLLPVDDPSLPLSCSTLHLSRFAIVLEEVESQAHSPEKGEEGGGSSSEGSPLSSRAGIALMFTVCLALVVAIAAALYFARKRRGAAAMGSGSTSSPAHSLEVPMTAQGVGALASTGGGRLGAAGDGSELNQYNPLVQRDISHEV